MCNGLCDLPCTLSKNVVQNCYLIQYQDSLMNYLNVKASSNFPDDEKE